jgi:acetyl esterase/lipase
LSDEKDKSLQDAAAHFDLAYQTNGHPRQKLDLFIPRRNPTFASPWPLMIWIHGGAFRMGSKSDHVPTDYLAQGYAIASLNYRLSQHAIFPAQIEDCKSAVRWLRARAGQYNLDPERFAAWGESAGGHLSAMLGVCGEVSEFDTGDNLSISSHVNAVVDYFGPTDFLQMDAHRMPEGMVHNTPDSPESELIGGPIQEIPEKTARANPITYVTSNAPPFLIIHGDQDPLVPYHQSVLLKKALENVGSPVSFYTVRGGGHGGFKDPHVGSLTRDFLKSNL